MNTIVSTSEIKLTRTNAGVLRIGNTRVSLDSIIIAFDQGATPEQILQDYDTLTLAEIYSVISYYLQNREEVNSYIEKRSKQNEKLRIDAESRFDHKNLRQKLLARERKVI